MSDPDERNRIDSEDTPEWWGSVRDWWSSSDLTERVSRLFLAAALMLIVVIGAMNSMSLPSTTITTIPPLSTTTSTEPRDTPGFVGKTEDASGSADSGVVWLSGLEAGDLSDWAGVSNSGNADSEASSDMAHSGDYSLAMTIKDSDAGTGTRVRVDNNVEGYSGAKNLPDDAYYSAWFYIPEHITITGHNEDAWAIFQWKQTHPNGSGGYTRRQLEGLKLRDLGDRYSFTLKSRIMDDGSWGQGATFQEWFSDDSVTVEAGEWFHVEAHRIYSDDPNLGRLRFWINGQEIFDLHRQTEFTGGQWDDYGNWRRQWTVNNYNTGDHSPNTHTLYLDDARIALNPQQP